MPFEYTEEYLRTHRLGANFDKPDARDWLFPHATAAEVMAYPASVDLRGNAPPIYNQGGVGSCVSQAGVGIFEWLEKHVDATKYFAGSRLAVYKWARDLDGTSGDAGTSCRQGAKTMAQYGVPHESLWPYNEGQYDVEPPQNVRNDAANHKASSYWSISTGGDAYTSINDIKKALNTPLPVMFSFRVYSTYDDATNYGGKIGMPTGNDRGGHANVIVGYGDGIQNRDGSYGAFIVRNSWGTSWGYAGYGTMPYGYASGSLINDAWVVAGESGLAPPPPPPGPSPVGPVGPPDPGPGNAATMHGFSDINILPYLAKNHNGQPTAGYHTVSIYFSGTATSAEDVSAMNTCEFVMLYFAGCPHAAIQLPILNNLHAQYPQITIRTYDVNDPPQKAAAGSERIDAYNAYYTTCRTSPTTSLYKGGTFIQAWCAEQTAGTLTTACGSVPAPTPTPTPTPTPSPAPTATQAGRININVMVRELQAGRE